MNDDVVNSWVMLNKGAAKIDNHENLLFFGVIENCADLLKKVVNKVASH